MDNIVPSAVNKTPRGNRYIQTISDGYSNLLTAIVVRTQTSAENIKALRQHWITKFGMPHEIIIVDNHPGFSNQLFKDFFATFNCKVTKLREHPIANLSNKGDILIFLIFGGIN